MRQSERNLPRYRNLGKGWALRLLSAWEELEAQAEGKELAKEGREEALCANACLLSKALVQDGKPVFENGRTALEALTAGQIAALARRWGEFDRECDPGPWDERAADTAKKGWSTRLMSAFNGVCSGLLGRFPPKSE